MPDEHRTASPDQTDRAAADEIAEFRTSFPLIEKVDVLVPDMSGIFRGKRLPAAQLEKLYGEGMRLPASTYALDVTGQNCPGAGLGVEDGDPDLFCRAVPGTLKPATWTNRPTAQVVAGMLNEDGSPFFADPRQVLRGAVDRLAARGLTPVVALELEFYLFDPEPGADGAPRPASGAGGRRQGTVQVYGMDELYDVEGFLDELSDACDAQGIPADTITAEYAAGQYEVNLLHVPDALAAADQAALFKRAVKGVARKHGMTASFMAKPLADASGNGLHAHVSLVDADGRNAFTGEPDAVSDPLRHAVGGCLDLMAESMAIFAPNANSYRRFQPDSYAPLAPCWGGNNRTVAVRVPPSPPAAARLEHRVASADANVYLALAAILHAMAHGLEAEVEPPPPIEGSAYGQMPGGFYDTGLPTCWPLALDRFDASPRLAAALGDPYHRLYSAVKRTEMARYDAVVPGLDYDWYLTSV